MKKILLLLLIIPTVLCGAELTISNTKTLADVPIERLTLSQDGYSFVLNLSRLALTSIAGIHDLTVIKDNHNIPLKNVPNLFIDLSHNQLITIPDSIIQLKTVGIDLSHNQITLLPDSICQLQLQSNQSADWRTDPSFLVKSIDLSHNKISTLPDSIGQLKALHINLSNNKLSILPDTIVQLQVNNIDLSYNRLIKLPDLFGQLKANGINLSHNQLTTIPDSIGESSVIYLNLSYNQLKDLPDSISQLKIKSLNLSHNKLTTISGPIGHESTEVVDLSYNQLTIAPDLIGIRNYADLSHNKLTSPPKHIVSMVLQPRIYFEGNNLITLSNWAKQQKQPRFIGGGLICIPEERLLLKKIGESEYSLNLSSLYLANIEGIHDLEVAYPDGKKTKLRDIPHYLHLDLSDNQLTQLPVEIGHLNNLINLNISSNRLSDLPQAIGRLTNLRNFNASNNILSCLTFSIGLLVNLRQLNASKNKLFNLPKSIGQLIALEEINLDYNEISMLPESFEKLTHLRIVKINNNRLLRLPNSFGKLQNITHLDLANNKLSILPDDLSSLIHLVALFVNNNNLLALPVNIGRLTNLITLHADYNFIVQLPESIGQLENLTTLKISNNRLRMLPDSICNLRMLSYLEINDNRLEALPDAIGNMDSLRSIGTFYDYTAIDVTGNQLSSLPISLLKMRNNIGVVFLDRNKFTTIPICILGMPNIRVLSISSNQIRQIPAEISQLQKIQDLYLMDNRISELPETLSNLSRLKFLNVALNKLTQIPDSFTQQSDLYLNASYNPLTLDQIVQLQTELGSRFIYVSENNLPVPSDRLIMKKDGTIDLSGLALTDIARIRDLEFVQEGHWANKMITEVTYLNLRNNKLQVLPRIFFKYLCKLKRLDLSNNDLVELPEDVLISCLELNIANNKLTQLPQVSCLTHQIDAFFNPDVSNTQPNVFGKLQRLTCFGNAFTIRPIMNIIDGKEQLHCMVYQDAQGHSDIGINRQLTKLALAKQLDYIDFKQELIYYSGSGSKFLTMLLHLHGASDAFKEIAQYR